MELQRLAGRAHPRNPRPWARRRHTAALALARYWGAVAGLFSGSRQAPVVHPAQEAGPSATPGSSITVPTPTHRNFPDPVMGGVVTALTADRSARSSTLSVRAPRRDGIRRELSDLRGGRRFGGAR
jgi:hypothetical protein